MKSISHRPAIFFLAVIFLSISSVYWLAAQEKTSRGKSAIKTPNPIKASEEKKMETATFGGGCFWCVEAVYQRVDGVKTVVSGYAGGQVVNPTYEAVCTGRTGHAEVCQITFDPSVVSFDEMLLIFFKTHDPTELNKQGADVGTQYRSVVFYHDDAQREAAVKMKDELLKEKTFRKITTEISPLPDFYPAEEYHQNFFKLHPEQAYCRNIIVDKVAKFEKLFKEKSKLQKERDAKQNLTK